MNFTFSKKKKKERKHKRIEKENVYKENFDILFYNLLCQHLLVSINFFNAIWVFVGIASSKEIFIEGFKPFCSNVHTPFVPLVQKRLSLKLAI